MLPSGSIHFWLARSCQSVDRPQPLPVSDPLLKAETEFFTKIFRDINSGCAGMISEDTQDAVSLPWFIVGTKALAVSSVYIIPMKRGFDMKRHPFSLLPQPEPKSVGFLSTNPIF